MYGGEEDAEVAAVLKAGGAAMASLSVRERDGVEWGGVGTSSIAIATAGNYMYM